MSKYECRQDKKTKRWRWQLVSGNGRIIADSGPGPGYARERNVLRAIETLWRVVAMSHPRVEMKK